MGHEMQGLTRRTFVVLIGVPAAENSSRRQGTRMKVNLVEPGGFDPPLPVLETGAAPKRSGPTKTKVVTVEW